MSPADLRTLMTAKGLSADEVAVLTHATPRAVYYWLAGERAMPEAAGELLELKTALMPDVPDARAADST